MAKKAQRRTLTYEQAVNFESADCLGARVERPRIMTLAEVAKAISAFSSSKSVHIQLSGKATKPKKLTTIKALKLTMEELQEMPSDAAAYGVLRSSAKKAMAWPVLWMGQRESKFLVVLYHDPARYGFASLSKNPVTVGPDKPWPLEGRQFGVLIDFPTRKGGKLKFKPLGELITTRQLTARYGAGWREFLTGHLEEWDDEGKTTIYCSPKPLPTPAEYEVIVRKKRTRGIDEWVEGAYGTIEGLGEELRDAFENTPESLQNSDVGIARDEAATALEDIARDKPLVPEPLKTAELFVPYSKSGSSRREIANEAGDILEAIINGVSKQADFSEDEEIKEFTSYIEEAISSLDEIEFPGMFG